MSFRGPSTSPPGLIIAASSAASSKRAFLSPKSIRAGSPLRRGDRNAGEDGPRRRRTAGAVRGDVRTAPPCGFGSRPPGHEGFARRAQALIGNRTHQPSLPLLKAKASGGCVVSPISYGNLEVMPFDVVHRLVKCPTGFAPLTDADFGLWFRFFRPIVLQLSPWFNMPVREDGMEEQKPPQSGGRSEADESFGVRAPSITLPKGGGAIRGIGEKFGANPVTGTGSMSVPICAPPGRAGFGPQLSLSYDSGSGNGPFGFGWHLSAPSITRRTDKGLPKYFDAEESDIFILSGAEDLVPVLVRSRRVARAARPSTRPRAIRATPCGAIGRASRPSSRASNAGPTTRPASTIGARSRATTSRRFTERATDARIADPADPTRVFTWLICESYDDKGNAIFYKYKQEDDANVDRTAPSERNRLIAQQFAQRYLKAIRYGNRTPRKPGEDLAQRTDWLFEVVFDYGEHDDAAPTTAEVQHPWPTYGRIRFRCSARPSTSGPTAYACGF